MKFVFFLAHEQARQNAINCVKQAPDGIGAFWADKGVKWNQ